jgi:hypothetical protein
MAGTTRLELATSAVTGTRSHWKYVVDNANVYRDVYRGSGPNIALEQYPRGGCMQFGYATFGDTGLIPLFLFKAPRPIRPIISSSGQPVSLTSESPRRLRFSFQPPPIRSKISSKPIDFIRHGLRHACLRS